MPLTLEIRRDRWASFVRRALNNARVQQGWTVKTVLEKSGIGKTTLYRWLKGDWTDDPAPGKIEAFCDAMGIPTERAFVQLWPGRTGQPGAADPLPIPDEVEALLRRLNDPKTTTAERQIMLGLVNQAAHLKLDEPTKTRARRA